MTYPAFNSSLPDTIREKLRQPTWIALVASLGIHGILLMMLSILPLVSSEPSETEPIDPVDLVELSPEEQSRLPDLSTSLIPPPPSPSAQTDQYSLRPLPNPFSSIPTVPNFPPSYRPPSSIFIPPTFPPAPPRTYTSRSPGRSPTTASPSASASPSPQASPSPSPRSSAGTLEIPDFANLGPQSSPSPTTSPSPTALQDLAAQQQQLRELLTFSDRNTSQETATQNYVGWFEQASAALGEDYEGKNAEQITLSAPYPRVACLNRLEGVATVGVLTDAEGAISEEPPPTIIRSSGYPLFNQQALELVENNEFEATGQREAYLVNVEFKYNAEACPAAFSRGASPSPSSSSSPSSSPAASQSAQPNTSN